MAYSIEDIESTTIAVGNDDEHYGHVLGIDGEPYPRVHIKPQGTVNIGNGQTPPTPIDTSGGVSPGVLSLAAAPYNVVANTDTNYTATIASAESAAIAAGKALLFPKGSIRAHVVLKPYLKYRGAGMGGGGTILKAPLGSSDKEIVALAAGPVIDIGFDGFTIDAEDTALWCMRLKAVDDGTHGGMWYSTLANFDVKGGTGGVWLQGGDPTEGQPHQFCQINRLLVSGRDEGDSWRGLHITGQVGQIDFSELEVTGNGNTDLDIFIGRQEDDSNTVIGDQAPYSLSFNQPTIQNAKKGVKIERARGIVFNAAYYEEVGQCVDLDQSATGFVEHAPRYANSGYNVANDGFLLATNGPSWGTVSGATWESSVETAPDRVTYRNGPGFIIEEDDNRWPATHSSPTKFVAESAAATINLGYANVVAISGGATTVQTLTNTIPEGSVIRVLALTAPVKFGKSGNLYFEGNLLTVPANTVVSFIRFANTLYLLDRGNEGYTDSQIGDWVNSTLQNSWVNYTSGEQTARYRKRGTEVDVEGSIAGGTTGTVCQTLPAGYRPAATMIFTIATAGGFGVAVIANTGTVTLYSVTGNITSEAILGRITFSTL